MAENRFQFVPPEWTLRQNVKEMNDRGRYRDKVIGALASDPAKAIGVPVMMAGQSAINALLNFPNVAQRLVTGDYAQEGGRYTSPDMVRDSFDAAGVSGAGAVGGQAAVPAMRAPTNALGIFAGPRAKNAPLNALERAKRYTEQGVPREEVYGKTGWFQGPDGNWRWEIDDSQAHVAVSGDSMKRINANTSMTPFSEVQPMRAEEYLPHPQVSEAYGAMPWVTFEDKPNAGYGGYYRAGSNGFDDLIMMNEGGGVRTPRQERSVGLHELQHYVQNREGWQGGANPKMFSQDQYDQYLRNEHAKLYEKTKREVVEGMKTAKPEDVAAINKLRSFVRRMNDKYGTSGNDFWSKLDDEAEFDRVAKIHDDIYAGLSKEGQKLYYKAMRTDWDKDYSPAKFRNEANFKAWQREQYMKSLGESEARAVQARMDLTPDERRARAPWLDYENWDDAIDPKTGATYSSAIPPSWRTSR